MANYKPVLYGSVPLLNGSGLPVVFDADTYPDGPPPDCCCPPAIDACCDLGGAPLTGTFSDKTGSAIGLPATVTFVTFAPGPGFAFIGTSNTFANPCAPAGGPTAALDFFCSDATGWGIRGSGTAFGTLTYEVISADCDAQVVVISVSFDNGAGCAGTFTFTVTG